MLYIKKFNFIILILKSSNKDRLILNCGPLWGATSSTLRVPWDVWILSITCSSSSWYRDRSIKNISYFKYSKIGVLQIIFKDYPVIAFNMGRIIGASVLLEQLLQCNILNVQCLYHIYEIVLRNVFDVKFGTTTSDLESDLKNVGQM